MSKVNQIEKTLQEIDATKFHKLIDSYLSKKYSYSIHSNGTKLGENKSSKGTPDSFVILESTQYVFIEYTTQKTDITKKFFKDLEKCFDKGKTGIPVNQIEKIILACNSDLSPHAIKSLVDYCKKQDTDCLVLGNSLIANELNNSYPSIAKDFLDISIDSGQILDYDDFIKTHNLHKYSTSLDTILQHRESEIAEFNISLEHCQILMITGSAGIGKTKLALDACQKYAQEKGFIFKTILNRGVNVFDDMKAYFDAGSECHLVLIDDVNRVYTALEYFQEYYGDKIQSGSLKIVATVRDYAKDKIIQKIPKEIHHIEIEVEALDDESIKDIIKNEYSITNTIFLERIVDVSQGNPRLALMAASVAKEHDRLDAIYDVTTLYDEYFSSVKQDIEAFEHSDLLLSIAIIAFFRVIDRENYQQTEMIKKAFGISADELWKSVEELHLLEIVDLYENNVVKVSDQILSTYLFYKVVFIDKKVKIDIFLEHFFPSYKGRFRDTLSPLLNTFNTQLMIDVLREPVNKLWIRCLGSEQNLYATMNVFWFLKQTDILAYFFDKINTLTAEKIDIESLDFWQEINTNQVDDILSRLAIFGHDYSNMGLAIELIISYFEKKPSKISEIITTLVDSFGYQYNSYQSKYEKEQLLIDTLWKFCDNGKNKLITKLFIRVSSSLIKTEFDDTYHKNGSMTTQFYKLVETEELHILRNSIFEKIFSLYGNGRNQDDIYYLIKEYPSGFGYRYGVSEVEEWDSQNILMLIQTYFDSSLYKHCKIAQDLLDAFDKHAIPYDIMIRNTFKHPNNEIEKILMLDDIDISLENPKDDKIDWDEMRQIKQERLAKLIHEYSFHEWEQLFEACILFFTDQSREQYKLNNNLCELFHILAEQNPKLYIEVFEKYLELGNPFTLNLNQSDLITILGKEKAYNLLRRYEYTNKYAWLFNFFIALPEEKITGYELEQLLKIYRISTVNELPFRLDYLERYLSVQPKVFIYVVNILVQRTKREDKQFANSFSIIFNSHTEVFKHLENYFESDIEVLKQAYLLCINLKGFFDHNNAGLNKLINLDNSFIEKYICEHLNKDNRVNSHDIKGDFTLIWNRHDHETIFLKLIESVFFIQKEKNVWIGGNVIKSFFLHHNNKDDVNQKADDLLKKYIDLYSENEDRIVFIFELICEFTHERIEKLIACFLKKNQSYSIFEKLSLEPMTPSWRGSRVPSLQKEIDFYSSLLKHMDSVKLLQQKQKIEQRIRWLKNDIEREKKNDFMEDDY